MVKLNVYIFEKCIHYYNEYNNTQKHTNSNSNKTLSTSF